MSITQSEYVFVTLGIQHAIRMSHIVIRGLPRSTIFFHMISLKARFSKKIYILIKKGVFLYSLQILSETFFILRRIERDMTKNVYWSSRKEPVMLVRV